MRVVCPKGHEVILKGDRAVKLRDRIATERCPHCGGALRLLSKPKKRSVRTVSGGLPSLGKRK